MPVKSLFTLLISAIIFSAFAADAYPDPGTGNEQTVSFTTSIADQEANVKRNIAIASRRLNGTVIKSGEVFSFNNTVGEGSAENGFLSGRVFYRDRVAYETGGGICQVSSTLFNALLLAGCSISERHRHMHPVLYVPPGLDATIKYGKKDLRMRNIYSFDLQIFTDVNESSLTVFIKASGIIPFAYEMFSEEGEINLPFSEDSGRNIQPGLSIEVYRKKYSGGKLLETFLMYRDFYPPVYIE